MDAIKQFLENYWFPTLFGAILVHSIWRVARRSGQPSAAALEIPPGDTHDIQTTAPFRRRDFAAKAEPVRQEMAKGVVIGLVVLIAAPPALAAISWLVPTLPRRFFVAAMTILCAAGIGSMFAFGMRGSRLMRRSGLICPACEMELVGTDRNRRSRQDRVLETGKCPGCRAQLLDPAEVGPISETLTRAEHVRYIGLISVLLVGLVAMVYFGRASIKARRLADCIGLYARAQTASDSVVIDSTRASRRDLVTCGEVRRANVP